MDRVPDSVEMVADFHRAIDSNQVDVEPNTLSGEEARLRLALVLEEVGELAEALGFPQLQIDLEQLREDLPQLRRWPVAPLQDLLKEICDTRYVLDGTTIACGLDRIFNAGFREVHASNMTKVSPPSYREDGKLLKGPNYRPPDLQKLLNEE